MLMNQEHAATESHAPTSTFGNTGASRSWTLSSVDSVPGTAEQQPSMAEYEYISSGNGEAEIRGARAPLCCTVNPLPMIART